LDALRRTRSSLATDPRDKIFALLGLTFDGNYFVPEPSYMDSVSQSFTDLVTALIQGGECLDFIYLRSGNRKVDGELPSWVPDWTDLDDPIAHRQLDCIMDHFSNDIKSLESMDVGENAAISISGTELKARGVLFDTINGLGSALTTNDGDIFAHTTAIPDQSVNPYKLRNNTSDAVYRTLVSNELFPYIAYETWDGFAQDLYRLWSIESAQQLEEAQLTNVSQDLTNPIWTWLAENRSFMVHGHTIEYWMKTWSQSSNGENAVRNTRHFFNNIRSCMRLLVTERGYLGWAHPQARKGDRIALFFGCCRPVILRAYQDHYHVVGDACLSGQSITDLLDQSADDEVENVRIL
jgi:hypothetical protein